MNPKISFPVLALLLTTWSGCSMDFLPPSYLDDVRVLAVQSDPLEVGPGEQLTLIPRLFVPADQTLTSERWTFCPFHLGPQSGYTCALPSCSRVLEAEQDGSLQADPLALALECLSQQPGNNSGGSLPAELPQQVEMLFTYEVEASGGAEHKTVLPIMTYPFSAPPARNRPPVVLSVSFAGEPAQENSILPARAEGDKVELEVLVDPESLDEFEDESGRSLVESPIISLYASAGRFDDDRIDMSDPRTTWKAAKLLDADEVAEFYVVVRDLRGGQSVAGPFFIPLER